ncbi:MAG: thioredoxin domain-containing protein [Thermodesulfobacteriota bacterium]|nr:MAG: thioredoxin domain-containing protein [Thermodesulfobacteriota bacterium]
MANAHRQANHLKDQRSPYLKQHELNPVDWYPWGSEALQKAKRDDKPLIISIGYASCHWCHVMERESFEDEETARIMNENFVNIKVDREERPDLDSLYIKAVQAMTGHAGWPLTVFATPDGVPFYGGSYFPPEDMRGMPSFRKVLLAVSLAYRKNRDKIETVTADVERTLGGRAEIAPIELRSEVADIAYDAARLYFDPINGGFGRGTKFPHAMFLDFLLRYHKRTGKEEAISMVKKTLSSMARGGIYDHLGGGFHRYSVAENWDIPHFEKMLYDNALLSSLYTAAYKETGLGLYRETAIETLSWLVREMRGEMGGFYSSVDADVEGVEGAYYVWRPEDIREALGDEAERFMEFFSVTDEGNYEGRNTLRVNRRERDIGGPVPEDIRKMKALMLEARARRKPPQFDRKIITAWNGLAISALSSASGAFRRRDFEDEAKRTARFVLSSLRGRDGRMLRYFLDGSGDVKGMLEDYALLAEGLLSIYDETGEEEWLSEGERLAGRMIELFHDESSGLFYDTGVDQERLFVRERDLYDNDLPSGNSAASSLLLRLYRATGKRRYMELSESILQSMERLTEEPISYGKFLTVLESFLAGDERPH